MVGERDLSISRHDQQSTSKTEITQICVISGADAAAAKALIGGSLLSGWARPELRHFGGPVLLGIAAVAWITAFWWLTLWISLAGRITWRRLFPSARATSVFWVGMVAVFSVFISGMVISGNQEYGAIGIIFAVMACLIAIGVVVILGAVVGVVWQERGRRSTPRSGDGGGHRDRQHPSGAPGAG